MAQEAAAAAPEFRLVARYSELQGRALYQHALLENELRLLTPQHSLGCKQTSYTLNVHRIEDLPNYMALSYTWGDYSSQQKEKAAGVIIVNGVQVPIGKNLKDALKHIRLLWPENCLPLWVDAICIDQDPKAYVERNRQVALMTRIFENASRLVCWLGRPVNWIHADSAAKLVACGQVIGQQRQFTDTSSMSQLYAQILEKSTSSDARSGLAELFRCEYWKRAWTLQEATSPRITLFLYGTLIFEKQHLMMAGMASLYSKIVQQELRLYPSVGYFFSLNFQRTPGLKLPLSKLLPLLRSCDCFDPRDKVYAISGLMTPINGRRVVPDYRLPVDEIYTSVVKLIAEAGSESLFLLLSQIHIPMARGQSGTVKTFEDESGFAMVIDSGGPFLGVPWGKGEEYLASLTLEETSTRRLKPHRRSASDPLSPSATTKRPPGKREGFAKDDLEWTRFKDRVGDQRHNQFLAVYVHPGVSMPRTPTWVPDWSTEGTVTGLRHGAYKAVSQKKSQYGFNRAQMQIVGFYIDTITRLSKLEGEYESVAHLFRRTITGGMDVVPPMPTGYLTTGENLVKAFSKTLCGDLMPTSDATRRCPAKIDLTILLDQIATSDPNLDKQNLRTGVYFQLIRRLHETCTSRRFCVTLLDLIGMCPEATILGDRVVAFHGSPVLHIVRSIDPLTNTVELVGECYIHGMMDGQVFEDELWEAEKTVTFNVI